jgi:hypothetical protein
MQEQHFNQMQALLHNGVPPLKASEIIAKGCGLTSGQVRKRFYAELDRRDPMRTSSAMEYAKMAITTLEKIMPNDPGRKAALKHVVEWVFEQPGIDPFS